MNERIQIQPELTGLALAYRNEEHIAPKLLPTVKLDNLSFQYYEFEKGSFTTLPETRVGEDGEANRVQLKAVLKTDTVEEHSLEAPLSLSRENQSNSKINRRGAKTTQLTDLLHIRREVNLSKLLGTASIYDGNAKMLNTNQKITGDGVDAVELIFDAMAECAKKPNKMVLNRKAAYALRRNKAIVQAVTKANIASGVASLQGIKELFELEDILVGESVVSASSKSTPEACWANNIGLYYINPLATNDYGVTFAYNAQYEDITISEYFEGRTGTKGATILKASMAEKTIVACPTCGYLLRDVVK